MLVAAPSFAWAATCGDGQRESPEQCDLGAANGQLTSCCTVSCQLKPAQTECRPATGPCDLAESCDGSSQNCPSDHQVADGTDCLQGLPGICEGGVCRVVSRIGLVGEWLLDEGTGTTVADTSGNCIPPGICNDGFFNGSPIWEGGRSGQALRVDYTTERQAVEIPYLPANASLGDAVLGSFTLSAWFKPASEPPAADATHRNYGGYAILGRSGEYIAYSHDRTFFMQISTSAGDPFIDSRYGPNPQARYDVGQWHHVAGVVNRSLGQMYLYINGDTANPTTTTLSGAEIVEHCSWWLGSRNTLMTSDRYDADGAIDLVRIYTRALSGNEIAALAREQAPQCGNGVVDLDEQCDLGSPGNGQGGTCCTSDCRLRSSLSACRVQAGACDVAESCDGVHPYCPADLVITQCGPSDGCCPSRGGGSNCDGVDDDCAGLDAGRPDASTGDANSTADDSGAPDAAPPGQDADAWDSGVSAAGEDAASDAGLAGEDATSPATPPDAGPEVAMPDAASDASEAPERLGYPGWSCALAGGAQAEVASAAFASLGGLALVAMLRRRRSSR
ncbi:MAG: hypothetical protein HY901_04405 [Deltaproteobacteria bacterium]|nr:hypothetical protein [Deltaproteobacteria bacterium]